VVLSKTTDETCRRCALTNLTNQQSGSEGIDAFCWRSGSEFDAI